MPSVRAVPEARYKSKRASIVPLMNFLYLAAVFAFVLYPGYTQYLAEQEGRKQLAVCRENIDKLHDAVEKYRRKHKGAVPETLDYFCQRGPDKIMKSLPICPACDWREKRLVYSRGYDFVQVTPFSPAVYTIYCFGNNHSVLALPQDHPYYSSLTGAHPTDEEIEDMKKNPEKYKNIVVADKSRLEGLSKKKKKKK